MPVEVNIVSIIIYNLVDKKGDKIQTYMYKNVLLLFYFLFGTITYVTWSTSVCPLNCPGHAWWDWTRKKHFMSTECDILK